MKLTIFNGSPRGKSGNSEVIANILVQNFSGADDIKRHYIKNTDNYNEIIKDESEVYFFVFPLYADAMPYAVKAFFECMEENKEIYSGRKFYFFIHSGFPEAKQSRLLERYLKYFSNLLGAHCMGVCIMGNSEMLRNSDLQSKRMLKIKHHLSKLAANILDGTEFNKDSIKYFCGMETLPKSASVVLKIFPLINIGFNLMLKQNGAYDKRFNKPYI